MTCSQHKTCDDNESYDTWYLNAGSLYSCGADTVGNNIIIEGQKECACKNLYEKKDDLE